MLIKRKSDHDEKGMAIYFQISADAIDLVGWRNGHISALVFSCCPDLFQFGGKCHMTGLALLCGQRRKPGEQGSLAGAQGNQAMRADIDLCESLDKPVEMHGRQHDAAKTSIGAVNAPPKRDLRFLGYAAYVRLGDNQTGIRVVAQCYEVGPICNRDFFLPINSLAKNQSPIPV